MVQYRDRNSANQKRSATCLVLGGAGFIGVHLVERLIGEGLHVRVFNRPGVAHRRLGQLFEQIESLEGDFQDSAAVSTAVQDCDIVFHLIGTVVPSSSNRDAVFDVETNLVTTVRLLEACRRAGVRKILFPSSGGTVYGPQQVLPIGEDFPTEPQSSYGIVKLAVEKYLDLYRYLHGLDYVVLRIGNVYGPGLPLGGEQNAIGAFLSLAFGSQPITIWGDGAAVRDYVYVTDVARAFVAAMHSHSSFRLFNIGTSTGTSLNQLVRIIEGVTAQKLSIRWEPSRRVDVSQNVLAIERARQYLKWEPLVELEGGLRLTWNWVCSNASVRAASST